VVVDVGQLSEAVVAGLCLAPADAVLSQAADRLVVIAHLRLRATLRKTLAGLVPHGKIPLLHVRPTLLPLQPRITLGLLVGLLAGLVGGIVSGNRGIVSGVRKDHSVGLGGILGVDLVIGDGDGLGVSLGIGLDLDVDIDGGLHVRKVLGLAAVHLRCFEWRLSILLYSLMKLC